MRQLLLKIMKVICRVRGHEYNIAGCYYMSSDEIWTCKYCGEQNSEC